MSYANLYCTRADVTRRLPPGGVPSLASRVAAALASSDVITLDGHGFESGDEVTVRASEGGSLASPLAENTTYYVIRLSNSAFQLGATSGGAAINLTTDAVEMIVIKEPSFDEFIEEYSRWADGLLPAHAVPLQPPIHPTVKGVVADCVAKRVMNIGGQDSAIVAATEVAGKAILERFAKGLVKLRGAPATKSANKMMTDRSIGATSDGRGWGSSTIP